MISVTGGSGFLGTRLCARLLRANCRFSIVDKVLGSDYPEMTTVADVREVDAIIAATVGASAIVNLAAEHRDDVSPRSLYAEVNVTGAKNVCMAAEKNNINRIVFTSTVAVYGFAPVGTNEQGSLSPFNDYGTTNLRAEMVYKQWQAQDPNNRSLVIIRPTVIFGERNRGNVYNLLSQIASGKFVMIGKGKNVKSMAYVENVAAFIEHSLTSPSGVHVHNYIDKPDFDINALVDLVYRVLGKTRSRIRLAYSIGMFAGKCFDLVALLTGRKFPISSIRVKKFCSNSMFNTNISNTGFRPPVALFSALEETIRYEFVDDNSNEKLFYTE